MIINRIDNRIKELDGEIKKNSNMAVHHMSKGHVDKGAACIIYQGCWQREKEDLGEIRESIMKLDGRIDDVLDIAAKTLSAIEDEELGCDGEVYQALLDIFEKLR